MRTRFLAGCAAALLTVGALGCEARSLGIATTGPTTGARVRLFNAVTSSQAVDFVIDGLVVASGIRFGAASPYVPVTLGSHRLEARVANTSTTLIDFTRDILTQGSFSLVPAPGLGQFGALFFADDPTPVPGQARLRVVNASASSGAVAVFLTAPGGSLGGATPTIGLLPFGSVSDYTSVTPGQYQVRITRGGAEGEVLLDTGTIPLGSGAVRTLLLTDAPGGGSPPELSVVSDAN